MKTLLKLFIPNPWIDLALAILAVILLWAFLPCEQLVELQTLARCKASKLLGPAGIISSVNFATLSILASLLKDPLFTPMHVKENGVGVLFDAVWLSIKRFSVLSLTCLFCVLFPSLANNCLSYFIMGTFFAALLSMLRIFWSLQSSVDILVSALVARASQARND